MANQNDTVARDRQHSTDDRDLIACEILDFSDLRSADGLPNHTLRQALAFAAVPVVGHFMFGGVGMAAKIQVGTIEATSSTPL